MNATIVIGMGNILMGDEGIGCRLVSALQERPERWPHTDFVDLGTAGFKVLHLLSGRERAIFIDCAFMNEQPGVIKRFTPADVVSRDFKPALSDHGGDLLSLIKLAQTIGAAPPVIVIFGIQPEHIGQAEDLSPLLQGNLASYLACLAAELDRMSSRA